MATEEMLTPSGALGLRSWSEAMARVVSTMPAVAPEHGADIYRNNAMEALRFLAAWCREVHGIDPVQCIQG